VHDPLTIKGATVQTALQFGTARLAMSEQLRENAARDAQAILQIATGLTRVQMLAQPDRALREEEAGIFQGMIAQRRGNVPIQHMRGSQEFFGRDFLVTPDVLIPRPETEHIIEELLRLYPDRTTALHIADVGTGSGILAITLALEYPQSDVVALDISEEALAIARLNAARLGVAGRIRIERSDLFEAIAEGTQFDIIVSNPPYIPNREASELHPQVRNHEPHLALFGGEDGLDIMRRLIPQAMQHLKPGGLLLMETAGRTPALDAILRISWKTHFVRDLQGIERIAVAQKA
jgi:release factor glutamine methyltransferase